ncbi:hypothetical protein VT06_03935 [Arsukibacterium sp. MJ3]|uniref:PepSY domain-containing protein n=1 Tax=Arsukibacterium sp. MJ3 TaxID=1632859 RepID=UPI0006272442|nr:PepSY domain-containing protein [Arsukibacterium sp. MJ3]KKO50138.1 hypothetical protein VT06_03935 [Arsukibacterium sp. MJ3]
MKHLLLPAVVSIAVLGGCAKVSEVQCTTAAKDTWQSEQNFKDDLIAKGYTINEFKVTSGNCYEIYGTDAQQNKVEIYFNPVDSTVVKQEKK